VYAPIRDALVAPHIAEFAAKRDPDSKEMA
jgi:hypothetical protein